MVEDAGSLAAGMSDGLLAPAALHALPSVAACTVAVERDGVTAFPPFLAAGERAAPARPELAD